MSKTKSTDSSMIDDRREDRSDPLYPSRSASQNVKSYMKGKILEENKRKSETSRSASVKRSGNSLKGQYANAARLTLLKRRGERNKAR